MNRYLALVTGCIMTVSFSGCSTVEHRYVSFCIAPNGQLVVFSSANGDLHSLDLKSLQRTQLTETEAIAMHPSFSPDGKLIAYAGTPKNSNASHIFACSLDGKQARQLTDTATASDESPSFSPDGSQIVFARAHRHRPYSMGGWTWDDWDICTMKANGSQLRRITQQKYYSLGAPRFSRDAKSIVYSADSHGSNLAAGVFEVNVNGDGQPVELAKGRPKEYKGGAWASEPDVSKDGKTVAFISDRVESFSYDIFIMDRDGTNPRPLGVTGASHYNQNPAFMPNGKSLLFLAGTESNAGNRPIYSLWRVDIDGKNPKQIADSGLFTNPIPWKAKK